MILLSVPYINIAMHCEKYIGMLLLFISLLLIQIDCNSSEKSIEEVGDDENKEYNRLKKMEQGPMTVSRTLDIGDGDTAWVIDNAFSWQASQFYASSFNGLNEWKGCVFSHMNYSKVDPNQNWGYGSAPWYTEFEVERFNNASTWKNLKPLVEELLQKEVKLQYGQLEILRSLDSIPPTKGKFCAPNRYVLTLFLTSQWNLNNYGQVSFYSKTTNPALTGEPRLEITQSVHPHALRAILWPSCHYALFRAPCVNYFHLLKYINIWMTTDTANTEDVSFPLSFVGHSKEEFSTFRFKNPDPGKIDFSKKLVRSFYDGTKDRPIHIFDDLFTKEEVRALREHLLKTPAGNQLFDIDPSEGHDNVQWMSTYDVESFMKTDAWPRFQALCSFVSNETEWFPYDVALNYVRTADHTRIHPDAELFQTELTMVMYLNEGMSPSDYGETTFVVRRPSDGVHEFIGPGGNLFEAIAAVAPKFGRVVIFRNNIQHLAHPPSTQFLGGRYTFAVKVSRTKHLAFVKRLYEAMETYDLSPKEKTLAQLLQLGKLSDPKAIATEKLEEMYKKVVLKAEKFRDAEHARDLLQEISPM